MALNLAVVQIIDLELGFASAVHIGYVPTRPKTSESQSGEEQGMSRTSTWLLIALLCVANGGALAADTDSGKEMYRRYCASCHGVDGKGNGPVASQLKIKLSDLTTIKKRNNGVFPVDNVMATIDGRRVIKGHGDGEMPVWGEVFSSEVDKKKYAELTTLLKAKLIAEYVATLQR
jgi:mono/diheme cytochrome c family protein